MIYAQNKMRILNKKNQINIFNNVKANALNIDLKETEILLLKLYM